jgi:hypothetical protein
MALSRILALNPKPAAQVLRQADVLYRKQIEEDPPIPWALLADLIEQGWSDSGLEQWLQPLRKLSEYSPRGHMRLIEYLVASDDEGHASWLPGTATR